MKKIALVAFAAAMLFLAYRLGAFEVLRDPAHLKDALLRLGSLGFLVYVVACAFLQPFGLPGLMFVVGASLVWPPPIAIALSLVGTTLASVNGFAFARYVARDWVEKRIPKRFLEYDERLATRGFITVLLLRSIFWMNPTLHALFGLSRVRFWTHLAASVLAYIPPIVALTYLGEAAFSVLKDQPIGRWLAALVVVAIVAVGWGVKSRHARHAGRARQKRRALLSPDAEGKGGPESG